MLLLTADFKLEVTDEQSRLRTPPEKSHANDSRKGRGSLDRRDSGPGLALGDRSSKLLQSFNIRLSRYHLQVIVIGSADGEIFFRLVRQVIEFPAMPGGNHGVGISMNHQQRTVDIADFFVIGKLIKGQEGNARKYAKSGDKGALQDESCCRSS